MFGWLYDVSVVYKLYRKKTFKLIFAKSKNVVKGNLLSYYVSLIQHSHMDGVMYSFFYSFISYSIRVLLSECVCRNSENHLSV